MREMTVRLLDNRSQITAQPEKSFVVVEPVQNVVRISTDGAQGPEGPPPEGSSIPQLTELTSLQNTDLMVIYDDSTATTKYVTLANLKAFVLA